MLKIVLVFFVIFLNLNAIEKLRVGVLSYGTVNWGLDVLKHHQLDKKKGFHLEVVKLASKKAQLVALLGGEVDVIVNDWIWVNTLRDSGKDLSFYPYSRALGTILVNKESEIKTLKDFAKKPYSLGVAGGPHDKTWLLIRSYYKSTYGRDFKKDTKQVFASPPIIFKKMLDNSLDGAINFWHFNSKLQGKGYRPIISIDEILKDLGVNKEITFVGWVFNRSFAEKNSKLINSFLDTTQESKILLKKNKTEWERIRPLMRVKSEKTFETIKQNYEKGIVYSFQKEDITELEKVFKILKKEAGSHYINESIPFDTKSFWIK